MTLLRLEILVLTLQIAGRRSESLRANPSSIVIVWRQFNFVHQDEMKQERRKNMRDHDVAETNA